MTQEAPDIAFSEFRNIDISLKDLPWGLSPDLWQKDCALKVDLPSGVSRHPVFFIDCQGTLLAVKEMASGDALKEYKRLENLENLRLPTVRPAGMVQLAPADSERSFLITHYLERSIPYRTLFMSPTKEETQGYLLDAMAVLLVQLHLAGVYWGDCSLSNTLFRRDAGTLAAYLVDAESVDLHSTILPSVTRFNELQMMEANILAEMLELSANGYEYSPEEIYETGRSIRQRYHGLWEEVTRQDIISPDESYRMHERIRVLNALGFSVEDVSLLPTADGSMLRLKIVVAGRNFHQDQLYELTGLKAEEMQALKLVNEIQELRAILSRDQQKDIAIEEASQYWLEHIYQPVINELQSLINQRRSKPAGVHEDGPNSAIKTVKPVRLDSSLLDPVELYCQVLEHKWYLSEQAKRDVGHMKGAEDFVQFMTAQDLHDLEA